MLVTEGLTKQYGDFVAVADLNLRVERGEIYGFLGPNGAGKTTTIMMLLGLERPTRGRIKLLGEELTGRELALKRRLGVVLEHQYFYEEMSAEEYLRFFADLYAVPQATRRVGELLELMNLADWRGERLRYFSKGMRQKVAIIRALLPDPELLLLDEPVTGLDPYGIKEVRDLILAENQRGRTVFMSSHILSEIERTCHRVGIIHQGRLRAEGEMSTIKQRLQREAEVILEVEALTESLVAALETLPFVHAVETEGRTLRVRLEPGGDHRAELSRTVAAQGVALLSLQTREMSLEEAFVTITEQNLSLLAETKASGEEAGAAGKETGPKAMDSGDAETSGEGTPEPTGELGKVRAGEEAERDA